LRRLRLRNAYLRREVGVAALKSAYQPPLVGVALGLCREHFQADQGSARSKKKRPAVP
jgi:hypothetical protein